MNGILCSYYIGNKRFEGILTTEHAASSYGIPVLFVDGVARGPAEVGELMVITVIGNPEGIEKVDGIWQPQSFYAAAEMAGFNFCKG